MKIDLTGRTALISGGSEGLGKATALHLARAGANIAIFARRETVLEAAVTEVQARAVQR